RSPVRPAECTCISHTRRSSRASARRLVGCTCTRRTRRSSRDEPAEPERVVAAPGRITGEVDDQVDIAHGGLEWCGGGVVDAEIGQGVVFGGTCGADDVCTAGLRDLYRQVT